MLRPATPLTVLLLVSFVLLLLSVISAPIIKGIPLATNSGINFGVFGYCKGSVCSSVRIGYTTDSLFNDAGNNSDFNLPFSSRHTLSSILVVHPIAAFMNLVCLGLAAAAHFHSPSHSARYLLGLLILLFPTLLVTLLAFLVDILLFVPHLAWGGWIVLASTILITASGVVTCAMRRTLVSRKARKRRIAENAEMSGENFYSRQSQEAKMVSPIIPIPTHSTQQQKPPMVNGAPGADNLPSFATYEASRDRGDEERMPLNYRTPLTGHTNGMPRADASDAYGMPPIRSKSQQPTTRMQNEYDNPLPPSNAFEPNPGAMGRQRIVGQRNQSLPPGSRPYARDNSFSIPRGGRQATFRGRGGYPSRGGMPSARSGYGGFQGQQGFGGRGGYDQRGGYPGRGRGGFAMDGIVAAGAGMAAGALNRGPGAPPPPSYPPQGQDDRPIPRPEQSPISEPVPGEDIYSPSRFNGRGQPHAGRTAPLASYGADRQPPARGQSPFRPRNELPADSISRNGPMPAMPSMPTNDATGQIHELDALSRPPAGYLRSQNNTLRDSDSDVEGMIGLQQHRQSLPVEPYSPEEYVPPRAAWAGAQPTTNDDRTNLPGRTQVPAELSSSRTNVGGMDAAYSTSRTGQYGPPRVSSGGSDLYYEDVDPRFANDPEPLPPQEPIPAQLTPGPRHPPAPLRQVPGPNGEMIPLSGSYENLQEGTRSPATSETSNFTSVSQRGVNPNWRPQDGGSAFNTGLGPPRRLQQQTQMRRDMMLSNNPDFEIPGLAGSARGGRGGRQGGGPTRRPVAGPSATSSVGMGGEGRYPIAP